MDSIGALTKLASIRAVGLVLDEIAVNTSMLQDIESKRRIPAVAKVMTASFLIKMAVIPAALLLTAFAPGVILPLVTFGGLHLAAEGVNHIKEAEEELGIVDKDKNKDKDKTPEQLAKEKKQFEKDTIKKVLVIDGLLSVEITVMTLPLLVGLPPLSTAAVLAMTGAIRTGWMYTLIGSIINMPRMGEWLKKHDSKNIVAKAARGIGTAMTKVNPYIVKGFEVAGTLALLMIGGGLLIHGIPGAEHLMTTGIGMLTSNHLAVSLLERVAGTAVGLAAGSLARKPLEHLYEAIGKGVTKAFNLVIGPFKHGKKAAAAPANTNTPVVKTPDANAAAPALQSVPDAKAALNTVAAKPAEVVPPAPAVEQNNTPVAPEQPKAAVPPKANP